MEYLIVSATSMEIRPLLSHFGMNDLPVGEIVSVDRGDDHVHFLATGVGMMQAAYHLGRAIRPGVYDHIIQAGIAGSFDKRLQIGEVVIVRSQQFGDLGVLEDGEFNDIFDMGLASGDQHPFHEGLLVNNSAGISLHPKLESASSLSVNEISSTAERIELLSAKYNTQLESMEGISFHYACLAAETPYAEIRGISNHVEVRNKENWDILGAVEQLNNYLMIWLKDR